MATSPRMNVIKRNGKKEFVSFDKVTKRLQNLSDDLSVDLIPVAQKVIARIYNDVKTTELDELAAQICMSLESTHLDYGKLASRIIISNNHKNTSPSFSETIYILFQRGLINDELYKNVMDNKDKLNSTIKYERDFDFNYFGFKTLEKAYLLKHKGVIIERPQHLLMRVSVGFHKDNIKAAIKSYEGMSQKYFIHATPTLYNSGTHNSQMASCFLLGTHDSILGIYKTIADCAKISKGAGGIGIHISNIRSKGSFIKGTNGHSNGIIPMSRVYNETARHVNQGGRRPGSFALYLEPHHPEVMQFVELRKNHGDENARARDLFLAMWISDLFMERVKAGQDWSFFNENDCPGLQDAYGPAYKELYEKYEAEGKAFGTMKAQDIWQAICTSQIETGTPYMLYKNACNMKSNQQNIGTIKSSNLCAEILEYSDHKEYAVCNLASVGLPRYVNEKGEFDYDKLVEMMEVIVRNIDQIIDVNYYPVPETKYSNMRHRPMGIGVQGLADVYAKMRIAFDSPEALEVNKLIFETMYYGALRTGHMLAVEKEAYSTFEGSPLSKGQFQFDLWSVKPPSDRYDWESLRQAIMNDGVRNSLYIALMPTASTSQILGNNECFEPFTSNYYSRSTIAGQFQVINKYLVKDLMDLNLWNKEMKDKILFYGGSVQNIEEIPQEIRNLYKTVWEMKQKVLIDQAADRGPFVCHTQSMNLFFEEPSHKVLTGAFFYGWKKGLKTGSYYIRTRPKSKAQQFTLDPEKFKKVMEENKKQEENDKYEVCEMCSS